MSELPRELDAAVLSLLPGPGASRATRVGHSVSELAEAIFGAHRHLGDCTALLEVLERYSHRKWVVGWIDASQPRGDKKRWGLRRAGYEAVLRIFEKRDPPELPI